MSDMTIEKAHLELNLHRSDGPDCGCLNCAFAWGFLEGAASRDPEVADLKERLGMNRMAWNAKHLELTNELSAEREAVEKLRRENAELMANRVNFDDAVSNFRDWKAEYFKTLEAEREASKKLVEALRATNMMLTTAGYGLKDCPCGTNDHCQLHDQAAKNAELLKFYATPGHSPEGKTL